MYYYTADTNYSYDDSYVLRPYYNSHYAQLRTTAPYYVILHHYVRHTSCIQRRAYCARSTYVRTYYARSYYNKPHSDVLLLVRTMITAYDYPLLLRTYYVRTYVRRTTYVLRTSYDDYCHHRPPHCDCCCRCQSCCLLRLLRTTVLRTTYVYYLVLRTWYTCCSKRERAATTTYDQCCYFTATAADTAATRLFFCAKGKVKNGCSLGTRLTEAGAKPLDLSRPGQVFGGANLVLSEEIPKPGQGVGLPGRLSLS